MGFAFSDAVTRLQGQQKVSGAAASSLPNVKTAGCKTSRMTFSELLSETIKKASQPACDVGSISPQQVKNTVDTACVFSNATGGNIVQTGCPLDLAMDGEGYFALNDGQRKLYTRVGAFAVDANLRLVDRTTGYLVQRIASVGEADGFQTPEINSIHIPYDVAMPAKATAEVVVTGNLSANATTNSLRRNSITSDICYTVDGIPAEPRTRISELDQFSGTLNSGTLTISGYNHDGHQLTGPLKLNIDANTTLGDVLTWLNTGSGDSTVTQATNGQQSGILGNDAVATLISGRVRVTDARAGCSRTDVRLSYTGDGTLTTPGYFEISAIGGDEVKNFNIKVYDSSGSEHVLSGVFVRTDTDNVWDMVLTSVTGNIKEMAMEERRIEGISFDPSDGSFAGLTGSDEAQFVITFAHDTENPQKINISVGTAGRWDGLTQFTTDSTAAANAQDGYPPGALSTVSVDEAGTVIGSFSNGEKKEVAAIQVAIFENAAGLNGISGGYYLPSAESGEAVATQAMTNGAAAILGGRLEKSNADVVSEFVNIIQAKNGFQANARSIKAANDILGELSTLMR